MSNVVMDLRCIPAVLVCFKTSEKAFYCKENLFKSTNFHFIEMEICLLCLPRLILAVNITVFVLLLFLRKFQ